MATATKRWAEGEKPTKAQLDLYITALQEVETITGEMGAVFASPYASEAEFSLLRSRRYLHFRSSGLLTDPAAIEDDITLNEREGSGRGTLDLDTTWVAYGQLCTITGVNACWHDDQP